MTHPVSINAAWRTIFSEANHQFLATLMFRQSASILKLGIQSGILDDEAVEKIAKQTSQINKFDLSDTAKLYYRLFETAEPKIEGQRRRRRLSGILHEATKRLTENAGSREEVASYRKSVRTGEELEALFRIIHLGRNVNAHDHSDITEVGWSGLIASTVLRILEVADITEADGKHRDALWSAAFNVYSAMIVTDPTEDFQRHGVRDREMVESPNDVPRPLAKSSEFAQVMDSLNEVKRNVADLAVGNEQELKGLRDFLERGMSLPDSLVPQPPSASNQNDFDVPNENSDDSEDSSDEGISETLLYQPAEKVTVEQAKQALQNLRLRIENEAEKDFGETLAPAEQILQRPIIDAMLTARIRKIDQWKNLPDVGWRYLKHQSRMDPQLDKWWRQIQKILNSVDWVT